jgi:hypothetical protein
MAGLHRASEPDLAEPLLAHSPLRIMPMTIAGLAAVAAAAATIWLAGPAWQTATNAVPASPADLSDRTVTEIDPADRAAVAAAVSMLRLPEPQRRQIEQEIARRERRIGWIVLVDSMDPDGDIVAVESDGLIQQVVLSKAWLPVAVPLGGNGPIGITAVHDGGGGGTTVALATRRGPVTLRALLPGERIAVMP